LEKIYNSTFDEARSDLTEKNIFGIFPKIGSDEVGKGDFFGPLVVCAVFLHEPSQLAEYAAGDSKTLSNRRILQSAPEIMKNVLHSVVKISPEKYNDLYLRFRNINVILGWAHAQAIKNILDKDVHPRVILIDKFGPEIRVLKHFDSPVVKEKLVFMVRAEEDAAVAAASVIARYVFLNEMKALGKGCGMELPLGAGELVDVAAQILAGKIGLAQLSRYVKIHFKNYSRLK
jgi:ribonuclease HIII